MVKREKKEYLIQSLSNALAILELFSIDKEEYGMGEIANLLGLKKRNTERLLNTLERQEYLERNRLTGNYRLGFRVFELGQRYKEQLSLMKQAAPVVREMAKMSGETSYAGDLRGEYVVYLVAEESNKHIRVVTLKKSRQKRKGRKPIREHERVIPIDDALLSELLMWKSIQEEKARKSVSARRRERLLTYVTAVGYTRIYKLVRKAVLMAGFDEERAHPHTFRHSFAVHLLKQGVPITVVQQLLGHSSIENTMIYTLIVQQEAIAFLRDVKW